MGMKDLPLISELASGGMLRPPIGLEAPFDDALAVIAIAEVGPRTRGRTVLTL